MALTPPTAEVQPRYCTPLLPGLPSYARKIDAVATAMGTPPMPWQRLASGLLGQVHPDGRMAFPLVVITVPRQAGKTTIVLATAAHRCLYNPARRVWYTAETGKKARDKWAEMLDGLELGTNPLRPLIKKTKRSNGDELLQWVNGSTFNPFPPTRDGLHSKQADLVEIDEGFAHTQAEGAAILAGAIPAQATRHARQIVVLSTMGDAQSDWFHNLVDFAKGDLAEHDDVLATMPRPAILDYGVPDGTDADDLETIAAYHPAFGYTIDMAALVDARAGFISANGLELGRAEFLRAYGNLRTGSRSAAFSPSAWAAAGTDLPSVDGQDPAFGVGVSEDGADGAIYAGFRAEGDVIVVDQVDYRPGTWWMVDRLVELRGRHTGHGVAGDPGGPAGPVLRDFEAAVLKTDPTAKPLAPFTRADYAAACADTRNRVQAPGTDRPRWFYRPDVDGELTKAAEIANRKMVGDGTWVWHRRGSKGSIACLEAGTVAGAISRHTLNLGKPFTDWG